MTNPYPTDTDWPADFQGCTITGHLVGLDGVPMVGTITFTATAARLISIGTGTIVVNRPVTRTLDQHGAFSIILPATDDPDINPTGFTYSVTVNLTGGGGWVDNIAAPQNTTVDFSAVVSVTASGGVAITRGVPGPAGPQGPAGDPATGITFNGILTGPRAPVNGLSSAGGDGEIGDLWLNTTNTAAMTLTGPKRNDQTWPTTVLATLSSTSGGAALVDAGAWVANTAYSTGQIVTAPDGNRYVAPSNFTSAATFTPSNWVLLGRGYEAIQYLTTGKTLALTDVNNTLNVYNAGAVSVTMPTDANVPIPIGASGLIVQAGPGPVTFVAQSGMSIRNFGSLTTSGQYGEIEWLKTKTTEVLVVNRNVSGAASATITRFTTPGTFSYSLPSGCKFIEPIVIDAGGGSGSGARGTAANTPTGGTGGAGAGTASNRLDASKVTFPVTVTVGAGGTAGAAVTTDNTAGNPGGAGGKSSFGTYTVPYTSTGQGAGGGLGGSLGGAAVAGGANSSGGQTPGGPGGSAPAAGAAPSSPANASGATGGGAGGSITSAGVASAGAPGAQSYTGGKTAGQGGANTGAAGTSPTPLGTDQPGAGSGGGGANTSGAGGAGAPGVGYGAGAGGGGASLNGNNSGAGATGAPGLVAVVELY